MPQGQFDLPWPMQLVLGLGPLRFLGSVSVHYNRQGQDLTYMIAMVSHHITILEINKHDQVRNHILLSTWPRWLSFLIIK